MSPKRLCVTSARLLAATLLLPHLALAQPHGAAEASAPPSKAECAQAFEEAQRQRNAAHYLDANREVRTCTNPSCGAALSEECEKIYNELQAATPSVVFAARDNTGRELANASVRIDDDASVLSLDGKPVALDPGDHTFSFQAAGFVPQTQSVVIRAGERFRPIVVVLQPPSSKATGPAEPASSEHALSSADVPRARMPLGVYVLGGVSVVGLGGFLGFRWWGSHEFDDLSHSCKPDCSSSSVDGVRQKYLLSNVSLAVAGAAAVGAVTWYFASQPAATANSAKLQVLSAPDGVSARFSAAF